MPTPFEQLDDVLDYIRSSKYPVEYDVLFQEFKLWDNNNDISIVLEKLERDKYILRTIDEKEMPCYFITFEGLTFIGYEKRRKVDNERINCVDKIAIATDRSNTRLIRATWFVGIAVTLLLLWQVFLYFHPHSD
jgi:hypothetical protein